VNEKLITLLMEEYKQLSSYLNNNATAAFRVLPVLITVVIAAGGIAWKENVDPLVLYTSISGIIFISLTWIGISQCISNGIGLKLTELEQKINRLIENETDKGVKGLSFYSEYVAEGSKIIPGFKWYYLFLTLAGLILLLLCAYKIWFHNTWISISILLINSGVAITIYLSEGKTRKLKHKNQNSD